MIRKLNWKDTINVYDFIVNTKDKYEDFYITIDKNRVYLKDQKLIKKILNRQEVFGIEEKGDIIALLLIYREKSFRSYVRILSSKNSYIYDLLKFLNWNFNNELFIKAKKYNPIINIAQGFFFNFIGGRGQEILLVKQKREVKNNKSIGKN
jgi:hypothetical protein